MLTFIDKLISPYFLLFFNLVIIFLFEFVGEGNFFAETGLAHAIIAPFIVLIVIRILSAYSYGDSLLKTFSSIQIGFFLFLGIVHLYEYYGLHYSLAPDEAIELSVLVSYLLWFLGNMIALEYLFRSYYKRSVLLVSILSFLAVLVSIVLLLLNLSSTFVTLIPSWVPVSALFAMIALFVITSLSLLKMKKILPIFENYSQYAIPGAVFVVFGAFFEYAESVELLTQYGISPTQNLYIAHFCAYAALSLLFIAVGKFKRPTGIYADM